MKYDIQIDPAEGTPETNPVAGALRVAYFVNQYPMVSHTFIRREILALERQGVEVRRYALRGWDATVVDAEDVAERGLTRYVLQQGILPLLGATLRTALTEPRRFWAALRAAMAMSRNAVRPLPYHLIYLAHACRLREWLRADPVRHLHAHFGTNSAEIAALLRLLGGPPYSFTVHGADEADNGARLALGRKVDGAAFAVAISAYTRSQLLRHTAPQNWDKVRVVHCGLDADFLAAPETPPPETAQFLCIGRFSGEKGHLILLDAFARVRAGRPEARLVLAGDGPLRPMIEARIVALGISDAVRITGWIDSAQVRDEIQAAHVLVQPSFQEGLPVVIMEAMALCRPVISTYVAGIPELVQPGRTGWLVPAGTVPELAEAMEDSAAAPLARRLELGRAAAARVRDRHSVEREAAKLAALFAGATRLR